MTTRPGDQNQTAAGLEAQWKTDARWNGVERDYTAEDVIALRGSVQEEHTLARRGSERLWSLLQSEEWVPALGALTGNQAVQQVRAGLKAIYLSGWQVAADANGATDGTTATLALALATVSDFGSSLEQSRRTTAHARST